MESKKINLLGFDQSQLEKLALENGESSFRGRQIYQWLYKKGIRNIEEVTVLPKALRNQLVQNGVSVGSLKEINRSISNDGTIKLLLQTDDLELIETVGIPTEKRLTICISSQIGCSMGCRFCATGKGGLQRSLQVHEIVAQYFAIQEAFGRSPSHVVFMGMGEPLLNTKAVLMSIRCFNKDLGIAQRRITLSTVGVKKELPKLAELAMDYLGSVQFTLALSLHAPNQKLREILIPTARNYPLNAVSYTHLRAHET